MRRGVLALVLALAAVPVLAEPLTTSPRPPPRPGLSG